MAYYEKATWYQRAIFIERVSRLYGIHIFSRKKDTILICALLSYLGIKLYIKHCICYYGCEAEMTWLYKKYEEELLSCFELKNDSLMLPIEPSREITVMAWSCFAKLCHIWLDSEYKTINLIPITN